MSPRPAPDLDRRRDQITATARELAEAEGWAAVTMRRLAKELGATQPVLYSAFPDGRQSLVDAVALSGFTEIAATLESVPPEPAARMRAYLDFATRHPRLYEAMFALPSGLEFGASSSPEPLRRAFAAIQAAFPGADARAEVAWAALHGLATLQAGGRLPASRAQARVEHLDKMLARAESTG
ncbi:TetR/AcrR family transcriptional regulator [Gryllotalpicola kribbensis]|jgi:AcrR family transcriptional regulator|uniref:TetR/AcrR family transcriptional regulator n=1 Tax=Gryllotalpicola kribbensis TaxID=993084 RepID=A0ABP8AIJ3_9MICO